MTPLTVPYTESERYEATVDCAAHELLGQALRECPEEPIETFFGCSPSNPAHADGWKVLDSSALAVELAERGANIPIQERAASS